MTLSRGSYLGPYEILVQIGAGGMGEVWKAKDSQLEREVAIKVLPIAFAEDKDRVRRFQQEAKVLAALNHPNLVQIHEAGEHEGTPYLVMELLEGETLRERLHGKPLPAKRAAEITREIAIGLSAAHGKGILHRDLKPENIWITKDGRIKILDFGLAKFDHSSQIGQESATRAFLSEPGVVVGTAGYMSPEQVRGEVLDARTDIFSLGIILWEMLTGRRPFEGGSSVEVMHAILKDDPTDLDEALKVPPTLERIVHTCLAKETAGRFHSAHDLAFALGNQTNEIVSGSGPNHLPSSSPKRYRKILFGIPALTLLILGVAIERLNILSPRIQISQATPLPFEITGAAFHPNGNTIFFSATQNGENEEIFQISNQNEYPVSLGIRGGRIASISPTGDLALIMRTRSTTYWGDLAVVSEGSKAPKIIARSDKGRINGAEFGPDGKDMVIHWARYPGRAAQAFSYKDKLLYEVPHGFSSSNFCVSPTRDSIAFSEARPGQQELDRWLVVVGLDSIVRSRSPLPIKFMGISSWQKDLVWGEKDLISVVIRPGSTAVGQLVRIEPRTGKVHPYSESLTMGSILAISAKGELLSLGGGYHKQSRFVVWQKPGQKEPELISSGGRSGGGLLSQDGKKLLFFVSPVQSPSKSFLASVGRELPVQIAKDYPVALSGDGKWAAIREANGKGSYRIRLVACEGTAERTLPGSWISIFGTTTWLSGDARLLLVYAFKDGAAKEASFLIETESGRERPLVGEIRGPLSSDGRWAIRHKEGSEGKQPREAVNLESGEERHLPEAVEGKYPISWKTEGKEIWLWEPGPADLPGGSIWICNVENGTVSKEFNLPIPRFSFSSVLVPPSITPDGKGLAYMISRDFPVLTYLYKLQIK